MKPRVLLLNPPGRRNYSRDYYLGVELEPDLRLPPLDLVCLSGILDGDCDLLAIDALAEELGGLEAMERAGRYAPDFVVFMVSAASYAEDTDFLSGLRKRCPHAKFVGMGDVYREIKEMAFSIHPFLDAVLLDFSTNDLLYYIRGGIAPRENLIFRNHAGLSAGPERHHYGRWTPPLPRWDIFPLQSYRWPFSGPGLCATLLTEFGCPFLCTYCPSSSLAYKSRELDSVVSEARLLKSLGVRHVLLRDQTFGSDRRRTLEMLERFAQEELGFSWACSTRVDVLDEELLGRMRRAGCVAVEYGIDSGDDEVLRAHKKGTTRQRAIRALEEARKCGLKVWGSFLIGLSLDTRETVERTLKLAGDLSLDHVSFRLESQRFAADYRRDMLVKGLVPPEAMPPDVPTSISVWQGRLGLSNQDAFDYYARARGEVTADLVRPA